MIYEIEQGWYRDQDSLALDSLSNGENKNKIGG